MFQHIISVTEHSVSMTLKLMTGNLLKATKEPDVRAEQRPAASSLGLDEGNGRRASLVPEAERSCRFTISLA